MFKFNSVLFKFVKLQSKHCLRLTSTTVPTEGDSTELSLRRRNFLSTQQRYKNYEHILYSSHLEHQEEHTKRSYGLQRSYHFKIKNNLRTHSNDDKIYCNSAPEIPSNWMQDFEYYDELNDMRDATSNIGNILGTADQTIPTSNVSCSGCGAILHCNHQTTPGRNVDILIEFII